MASIKHIGIEINDGSVKYLELSKSRNDFELGLYGEVKLPEGMIEGGSIRQGIDLERIISAIRKKGSFLDATVSQSPDQVFLADILKEAGFKNIYLESSGVALARVLMPPDSKETCMIVYFTGRNIDTYAGERNNMKLLATSPFKSELVSKTLDKEIIFSFIREKIDEQYVSWHTHTDPPLDSARGKTKSRAKVSKLIFAGELPELADLADYLGKHLKVKTELGNAWINIFSFDKRIPEINFKDSLRYAAAIGLAFRVFEK